MAGVNSYQFILMSYDNFFSGKGATGYRLVYIDEILYNTVFRNHAFTFLGPIGDFAVVNGHITID